MGNLSLAVSHSLIRIDSSSERCGVPAAVIGGLGSPSPARVAHVDLGSQLSDGAPVVPVRSLLVGGVPFPALPAVFHSLQRWRRFSLRRRSRPVAIGEVAATEQCSIELGGIALQTK